MTTVHHRYANVRGRQLFYREAGPTDAPTLVLLHGFPASSFMFRDLIPLVGERYHVIAPDYLGFGLSDAPPTAEFDYSFDALADLTAGLLDQLDISRYAMYVQDYGAPVGWRLALANPDDISAIITQSGNAYEAGFVEAFWSPIRDYWKNQNAQTEAAVRETLTLESIRWQYLQGVPDPSVVSPDTWQHDLAQVSRPGNDLIQLRLLADYQTVLPLYPRVQAYLRESRVPVLAVWGHNDPVFAPAGALAYADDAANVDIQLLDGGHFLLETRLDAVADAVRKFLERTLQ
jgi:pimeloyl-ACP methyl ester carboxylesterase